jgi:hypothetical protein
MQDLIALINNDWKNAYAILNKNKLLTKLVNLTKFLPDNCTWSQRIWHLKNNLLAIPKCPQCNINDAVYSRSKSKYTFCSTKCNRDYSLSKQLNTVYKKYGANYFQSNEFKNKIKESLKSNYGLDYSKKISEKAKKTIIGKYGVDNINKIKGSVEKGLSTKKKKFGENFGKILSVKAKESIIKNHGENFYIDGLLATKRKEFFNRRIREIIDDEYEIVKYGSICEIIHKKCGQKTSIVRSTLINRNLNDRELCFYCNPKNSSQLQKEFKEWLKSVYNGEIVTGCRNVISKELDFYLPELKLAIEFNGLYWHSELFKKKNYHKLKSDECDNKNIKLVHLWENDWLCKKDIIKSIINNYLNVGKVKIYARKCIIKKVGVIEAREFTNKNHLQGFVNHTVCYGLYHNEELVQLMSFIKKKDYWEIQRLCTKLEINVIGGAERLWRYFCENNKPNFVITYSNRDYFTGKVYEKLGMNFEKITEPSLFYYDRINKTVISRQQFRKIKSNDFLKIFNSGNYKFYKKF